MLSDWGNTLMSEAGPTDIPMPDWPEVRTIDGAREVLSLLSKSYRIAVAALRWFLRNETLCVLWRRVG